VQALGRELDPGIQGQPVYPAAAKIYDPPVISEDCLYLNIWVPTGAQVTMLPVYLYYHGGANMVNAGSFELESGKLLAKEEKVIVVRPNYRLGALGWVHFGLISEELSDAINLGLQDQIAALRWVSENIGSFGETRTTSQSGANPAEQPRFPIFSSTRLRAHSSGVPLCNHCRRSIHGAHSRQNRP
jgi:para-nitrobenzyl esterase